LKELSWATLETLELWKKYVDLKNLGNMNPYEMDYQKSGDCFFRSSWNRAII
jgi:hypothetical protein